MGFTARAWVSLLQIAGVFVVTCTLGVTHEDCINSFQDSGTSFDFFFSDFSRSLQFTAFRLYRVLFFFQCWYFFSLSLSCHTW